MNIGISGADSASPTLLDKVSIGNSQDSSAQPQLNQDRNTEEDSVSIDPVAAQTAAAGSQEAGSSSELGVKSVLQSTTANESPQPSLVDRLLDKQGAATAEKSSTSDDDNNLRGNQAIGFEAANDRSSSSLNEIYGDDGSAQSREDRSGRLINILA